MKVSLICPARSKAQHLGKCIRSLLAQDFTGELEIVISVQPSEDATADVARNVTANYYGWHTVRVLDCPVANYQGMAGLNEHFNWIHTQIDGDLIVNCSADDYVEPGLVTALATAYQKFNPSYVGARLIVEQPNGTVAGMTDFPERASRHIAVVEAINHQIGSSMSSAWSRDLWMKYGPLRGVESQDMLLPLMAFFERGVYYVDEPLHHHVLHADPNNTGTEGQMRAAQNGIEAAQLGEVNGFHATHHWVNILRRINENGFQPRLTNDALGAIYERIMNAADYWVTQRSGLTMARIEPKGMRV